MKAKTIAIAFLLLSTACSNQYRTSDPQMSSDAMMQLLSEAQGTSTQSTGQDAIGQAMQMKADPNTTIYFADAPGPMGTVASVLAFDSLSFLGAGADLYYGNISQARVFFLDNPFAAGGRQDVLIVGIASAASSGQFTYYSFSGSGALDSGEFSVSFTGGDGRSFTLRSFDLDGDSLAAAIQLRAYTTDGSGNEVYLGKFSTLSGYH